MQLARCLRSRELFLLLSLGFLNSQVWGANVERRHIFYNDSAFDTGDPLANAFDDGAIATDKAALFPGSGAAFPNYTSYAKGINGVMIDIAALPTIPNPSDFEFRVGNDNNPAQWPLGPVPLGISVRFGDGMLGSDRVTILWADNAIEKTWLQVTVKVTANTGLAEPDVFYFGNAPGESGDTATDALVGSKDVLGPQNNPMVGAPINNAFDYNRDALVDANDATVAQDNQTGVFPDLHLILTPTGPGIGVTSVSPEAGIPGTIIRVDGVGFDSDLFENTVYIGGSLCRIISGDASHLRVVALRDLMTGLVEVKAKGTTAFSTDPFLRGGTTTLATPLADSDAELEEGMGFLSTARFDMMAQGLNQPLLVVLASPTDIDPEDLAPMGMTARDAIIAKFAEVNTFFQQASYGLTSANFTVTDWFPLSQGRDFYCWQQEDVDRAQTKVDAAQADLDGLQLDPGANQGQIDAAEAKLEEAKTKKRQAQDAQGKLQERDFAFAEALVQAKADLGAATFNSFTDYVLVLAGPFKRGANYDTETGFNIESEIHGIQEDITFNNPKGIVYYAQGADWGRVVHELSHFFAGGDLYTEGFADGSRLEGLAAPFAMMGSHDSHPLYIGQRIEKLLDYFNESVPDGNVRFLEWGSVPDFDEVIDLVSHAITQDPTGDDTRHLIKLQVTEGLVYYVEVRQRPDPSFGPQGDYVFDENIPLDPSNPPWEGGVIIYKSVENNNQSNNKERPVNLLPPFRMLQVGEGFSDPARTIQIDVVDRLVDRPAKYRVRVQWGTLPAADPDGQFDLRITPWGAPPWETEDIWVNSPKNDETMPAKVVYANHEPGDETMPIGNGDPPWVGHDNTIFARIKNHGQVETPETVKITFYVNTPPGVGDSGTWAPFDTIDIGTLMPDEVRVVMPSKPWRPALDKHTCLQVQIHSQHGEITFDNNVAQENFFDFETGAASPYFPFEFDVLAQNPYDAPGVMDLKVRNLPEDWFAALDHGSVFLPPLSTKPVHVVLWTDRIPEWEQDHRDDSPPKALIDIEGWMELFGDRMFPVGGATVLMRATRLVKIKCTGAIDSNIFFVNGVVSPVGSTGTPNVGVTPVAIHVTDPQGNLHVNRTKTDFSGNFNGFVDLPRPLEDGEYQLQCLVLRGSLAHTTESEVKVIPYAGN